MRLSLALIVLLMLASCATFSESTPVPPSNPAAPLGFPGNPLTSNAGWSQVVETFNGVDMMLVPVGCFMMGSDAGDADESPVYAQCFRQPFWIDRFEVTNAQFAQLNGVAQSPSEWAGPNQPRTNITWFEARDFCIQRGGRLPTEAEWEYAARGPDGLLYPWGNTFVADYGVFENDPADQSLEVGSRGAGMSWVGAFDMAGNVWEWTSTIFDRFTYPYTPDDGREDLADSVSKRVIRGGSWYDGSDFYGRAANRGRSEPLAQNFTLGFRCVRDY